MAKTTVTEEAFDALAKLQNDLLRTALDGKLDAQRTAQIVDAISEQVGILRRVHSRVLQAARGELNDDRG